MQNQIDYILRRVIKYSWMIYLWHFWLNLSGAAGHLLDSEWNAQRITSELMLWIQGLETWSTSIVREKFEIVALTWLMVDFDGTGYWHAIVAAHRRRTLCTLLGVQWSSPWSHMPPSSNLLRYRGAIEGVGKYGISPQARLYIIRCRFSWSAPSCSSELWMGWWCASQCFQCSAMLTPVLILM